MNSTFGAPSGAFGGRYGAQSGTESRMSTLILPLNSRAMMHLTVVVQPTRMGSARRISQAANAFALS